MNWMPGCLGVYYPWCSCQQGLITGRMCCNELDARLLGCLLSVVFNGISRLVGPRICKCLARNLIKQL